MKISQQVFRRFIAGKQGLWPGRRWAGLEGLRTALKNGVVIQIDPLCVLARSHDLALNSRVLDYRSEDLNSVLYTDRCGFDWGGTVYVHPMEHIPYYRAVMERMACNPYWEGYAARYASAIEQVSDTIRREGPQSNRSFKGGKLEDRYWRTGKDTGRALYYLWMTGRMMTSGRKGFERYYDFSENIIPDEYQHSVTIDSAEEFLAEQVFEDRSAVTLVEFKNAWAGRIERKMDLAEAEAWLAAGLQKKELCAVNVDGNKNPYYIRHSDQTLLEMLQDGSIPEEWKPIQTDNGEEALFLAPLEIISARGRAKSVFSFEYLWEVYKPVELRRWGYYNIPILFEDLLVGRIDAKVDRRIKQLQILGYWPEDNFDEPPAYRNAFLLGLDRLRRLAGAETVTGSPFDE